jgi:hypothetical protein
LMFHRSFTVDGQLAGKRRLQHRSGRTGGSRKLRPGHLDPAGGLGGGQEGRPALDGPGEQDLRRGIVDSLGDSGNDRIFQQRGLATSASSRSITRQTSSVGSWPSRAACNAARVASIFERASAKSVIGRTSISLSERPLVSPSNRTRSWLLRLTHSIPTG